MPREMAGRVDSFRQSRGLTSEAEAMRTLIEAGFLALETPDELLARCEAAHKSGKSLMWIAANIIEQHPLHAPAKFVQVRNGTLTATLEPRDDLLADYTLRYDDGPSGWRIDRTIGP